MESKSEISIGGTGIFLPINSDDNAMTIITPLKVSIPVLSILNEPKSYKMKDAYLLELNKEVWENIWKEHMQFRDTTLKQITSESSKFSGVVYEHDHIHVSYYINSIHLNFKLIKLERRFRKYTNSINLNFKLIELEKKFENWSLKILITVRIKPSHINICTNDIFKIFSGKIR